MNLNKPVDTILESYAPFSKKSALGYRGQISGLSQNKMAARRERFSREQIIEQVSVESVEIEEDEGLEVSFADALERSMSKFNVLRPSMSNFSDFKEAARQLLMNVYHRHEDGVHGMDKALMSSIPAWTMITSEVLMWLNRIRRRMSANPKASNPWTIQVKRDLPQEMFEILMKSVQGAPSTFGVLVEKNMIKYTNRNCLLRDFSKFSGLPRSEVAGKFNKTFGRNRKGQTEVLVSREKHFVLAYNRERK